MTAAVLLDYPPEFVEPAYAWAPPRRGTYGPEIVDFMASIGHGVDAEQAADIDLLASYGAGGTYLTLETAELEARQNGKTDRVGLPIALADVWLFGHELTWSAHRVDTMQDVFKTVKRLIDSNDSLSSQVKNVIEQRAEWAIELTSGALFEFRIRGGGGGRGIPRDIWVIDEALYVNAGSMGDRLPTLSSKPNPQVRYLSSGCKSFSSQLRSVVRRGRPGGDPSLIYVERCAPGSFRDPGCAAGEKCRHQLGVSGCVLDREELYHLGNHRIGRRPGASYQFIRAERRTLPPQEFARERFGWHEDGPDDDARHPLTSADWSATAVEVSPDVVGRPVFFLAVGPDGAACIASAADQPGEGKRPHVELVDRRPGSTWLPSALKELAAAWPEAIFGASKAGPVKGMVEAGLPVRVELLSPGELAQACRHHESLLKARTFTHSKDPDVDLSFAGAVSKLVGDGLWVWDWKASENLAPIACETGALGLLESRRGKDPLNNIW